MITEQGAKTKTRLTAKKRKELGEIFHKHGFDDYKWIHPSMIVVSQWVRMKCTFGCREYGRTASCPPNVPSVAECERFFREYKDAVIFHFEKKVEKPEDRFNWARKLNIKLVNLEREVFLSGFERAFLLFMDSCSICEECTGDRATCKEPRLCRPAPEALAVDLFSTVRQVGYPIEVLSDYSRAMNRYSFLMVA
jgi:predicted metal-binding protein